MRLVERKFSDSYGYAMFQGIYLSSIAWYVGKLTVIDKQGPIETIFYLGVDPVRRKDLIRCAIENSPLRKHKKESAERNAENMNA